MSISVNLRQQERVRQGERISLNPSPAPPLAVLGRNNHVASLLPLLPGETGSPLQRPRTPHIPARRPKTAGLTPVREGARKEDLKLGRLLMTSLLEAPEVSSTDSLSRFFFDAWLSRCQSSVAEADAFSVAQLATLQNDIDKIQAHVLLSASEEVTELMGLEVETKMRKAIAAATLATLDKVVAQFGRANPVLVVVRKSLLPVIFVDPPLELEKTETDYIQAVTWCEATDDLSQRLRASEKEVANLALEKVEHWAVKSRLMEEIEQLEYFRQKSAGLEAELEAARRETVQLLATNQTAQAEVSSQQSESLKERLLEQAANFASMVSEKNANIQDLQEHLANLERERLPDIREEIEQLEYLRQKSAGLEAELEAARRETVQLLATNQTAQAEVSSQQSESLKERLLEQAANFASMVSEKNANIQDLQEHLANLERERLPDIREDLRIAIAERNLLHEEVVKREEALSEEKAAYFRALQDEHEAFSMERVDLQTALEVSKAVADQAVAQKEADLAICTRNLALLVDRHGFKQHDTMPEELLALTRLALSRMLKDNAATEGKLLEQTKCNQAFESLANEARAREGKLQASLHSVSDEMAALRTRCSDEEDRKLAASRSLTDLEKQLQALSHEKNDAIAAAEGLKRLHAWERRLMMTACDQEFSNTEENLYQSLLAEQEREQWPGSESELCDACTFLAEYHEKVSSMRLKKEKAPVVVDASTDPGVECQSNSVPVNFEETPVRRGEEEEQKEVLRASLLELTDEAQREVVLLKAQLQALSNPSNQLTPPIPTPLSGGPELAGGESHATATASASHDGEKYSAVSTDNDGPSSLMFSSNVKRLVPPFLKVIRRNENILSRECSQLSIALSESRGLCERVDLALANIQMEELLYYRQNTPGNSMSDDPTNSKCLERVWSSLRDVRRDLTTNLSWLFNLQSYLKVPGQDANRASAFGEVRMAAEWEAVAQDLRGGVLEAVDDLAASLRDRGNLEGGWKSVFYRADGSMDLEVPLSLYADSDKVAILSAQMKYLVDKHEKEVLTLKALVEASKSGRARADQECDALKSEMEMLRREYGEEGLEHDYAIYMKIKRGILDGTLPQLDIILNQGDFLEIEEAAIRSVNALRNLCAPDDSFRKTFTSGVKELRLDDSALAEFYAGFSQADHHGISTNSRVVAASPTTRPMQVRSSSREDLSKKGGQALPTPLKDWRAMERKGRMQKATDLLNMKRQAAGPPPLPLLSVQTKPPQGESAGCDSSSVPFNWSSSKTDFIVAQMKEACMRVRARVLFSRSATKASVSLGGEDEPRFAVAHKGASDAETFATNINARINKYLQLVRSLEEILASMTPEMSSTDLLNLRKAYNATRILESIQRNTHPGLVAPPLSELLNFSRSTTISLEPIYSLEPLASPPPVDKALSQSPENGIVGFSDSIASSRMSDDGDEAKLLSPDNSILLGFPG